MICLASTEINLGSTSLEERWLVRGDVKASVTQYKRGKVTFRSSASMTFGSSSRGRWTWVSPEYQPRASILIQRSNLNCKLTGLESTVTWRDCGRYSLPRSTVIS